MTDSTGPLKKKKVKAKQILEKRVPARDLEGAYGENEPEYTLDMLIAVNPEYKGTQKKCDSESRVPARGLERTYSEDEPEYTLDMLIAVNPEYKGT